MGSRRRTARSALLAMVIGASLANGAHAADAKPDPKPEAHGEAKAACFDAYEQAQRLRKANDLRAAREKLAACANAACPDFVRKDCAQWSTEVEAQIPTIVVQAKDAHGKPATEATVSIDGQKVSDRLDGQPLPINPGEHTVRVEMAGKAVDQKVTANEGKHDVLVIADFGGQPSAATPPPAPPAEGRRGLPVATYALGGVAVAGLAAFAAFGISGTSAESCKPNCSRSQVESIRRELLFADISLLVALAAGGGALYFALSAPKNAVSDAPPPASARLSVGVTPTVGGGFVAAHLRF